MVTGKIMHFLRRYVKKELIWQKAGFLTGILAFVWWCVLYPELCFPPDVYEPVYETEADYMKTEENNLAAESKQPMESRSMTESNQISEGHQMAECYRGLLRADEEQVIVKSRLFEWLEQYIE